jgi:bifunctional DNase/RNase
MIKIGLEIIALSHSVTQSHNYAVILQERGEAGTRRLPVVIGAFEAQSIAVAIERMTPSRPLTHDLLKNSLDAFDIDVKEVIISNLIDGVFFATIIYERTGIEQEIDARTFTPTILSWTRRVSKPITTPKKVKQVAVVSALTLASVQEKAVCDNIPLKNSMSF